MANHVFFRVTMLFVASRLPASMMNIFSALIFHHKVLWGRFWAGFCLSRLWHSWMIDFLWADTVASLCWCGQRPSTLRSRPSTLYLSRAVDPRWGWWPPILFAAFSETIYTEAFFWTFSTAMHLSSFWAGGGSTSGSSTANTEVNFSRSQPCRVNQDLERSYLFVKFIECCWILRRVEWLKVDWSSGS